MADQQQSEGNKFLDKQFPLNKLLLSIGVCILVIAALWFSIEWLANNQSAIWPKKPSKIVYGRSQQGQLKKIENRNLGGVLRLPAGGKVISVTTKGYELFPRPGEEISLQRMSGKGKYVFENGRLKDIAIRDRVRTLKSIGYKKIELYNPNARGDILVSVKIIPKKG